MIPPKQNAEFVAAMEDVLEVYQRPYDARRPVVCLDEQSKQLVKQVNKPLPMQPGSVAKEDYEYERNGTANLFMLFEPLGGWRHVKVTERRTKIDFAHMDRRVATPASSLPLPPLRVPGLPRGARPPLTLPPETSPATICGACRLDGQ